ncbi:hypothetical protein HDE68_004687 [Pedobacter cryoconitis]|uniref:Uncharacterized protein n=1 Tax=Pedobacter cryoconitis TaxID=188932 RepID=A0A7W9E0R6_9SPHI|nr:hypothetical protein [Pedobacter cryoconitis]
MVKYIKTASAFAIVFSLTLPSSPLNYAVLLRTVENLNTTKKKTIISQ